MTGWSAYTKILNSLWTPEENVEGTTRYPVGARRQYKAFKGVGGIEAPAALAGRRNSVVTTPDTASA